MLAGNPFL